MLPCRRSCPDDFSMGLEQGRAVLDAHVRVAVAAAPSAVFDASQGLLAAPTGPGFSAELVGAWGLRTFVQHLCVGVWSVHHAGWLV